MQKPFANRLKTIPPYLFAELDVLKAKQRAGLIDLGEGNPDLPVARAILLALRAALKKKENHRYPTYAGKPSVRQAVARWYKKRFGVHLDPEKEVVLLIGSKEGAAHLIWALADENDKIAVCDPNYPVYLNQTRLAGAIPVTLPLEEKNGFLPDLDLIKSLAPRLKLLCLNYPNNPTAACAPLPFYQEIINLALKFGFYVINDNVYSEIYFTEPPPSILQVPDAINCAVELHSLSKTFSIPGWRIGMAVGNRDILAALLKIKQNVDSGPFGAIQDACAFALKNYPRLAQTTRKIYHRRALLFCTLLNRSGWQVQSPQATFYLWAKLPPGFQERQRGSSSFAFTLALLENCRVVTAPGIGFGRYGEGYVRFALVVPDKKLQEAARRINSWLKSTGIT
ncbi:MAG: aminotransferase class I/II-fold pyridoxal phosphate-dependent enzyme [candidate division WOR-3 bacterium]